MSLSILSYLASSDLSAAVHDRSLSSSTGLGPPQPCRTPRPLQTTPRPRPPAPRPSDGVRLGQPARPPSRALRPPTPRPPRSTGSSRPPARSPGYVGPWHGEGTPHVEEGGCAIRCEGRRADAMCVDGVWRCNHQQQRCTTTTGSECEPLFSLARCSERVGRSDRTDRSSPPRSSRSQSRRDVAARAEKADVRGCAHAAVAVSASVLALPTHASSVPPALRCLRASHATRNIVSRARWDARTHAGRRVARRLPKSLG
jgi:hypothetical protein